MGIARAKVHLVWKNHLFAMKEWGPIFEFEPFRSGGAKKPILAQIHRMTRFEKRLIDLCRKFDFDLSHPKSRDDIFSAHSILDPTSIGTLDFSVAERLLAVKREIHDCYRRSRDAIRQLEIENKLRRRGPVPAVPGFFAKQVLVGLLMHQGSEGGLNLLRRFLEPSGGLHRWLRDERANDRLIAELILARGERGDILKWAQATKQKMERAIISSGAGKSVKSMVGYERDVLRLRKDVSKCAAALLRKAK